MIISMKTNIWLNADKICTTIASATTSDAVRAPRATTTKKHAHAAMACPDAVIHT